MVGKDALGDDETLVSEDALCRAWNRGTRILTGAVDAALAEVGLTAAEFEILNALTATCSLRMVDLAELAVLTKSGATRAIQRLETQALVERRGSGCDRRSYVVSITARGHELWETGRAAVVRTLREQLLVFLSERDRAILVRIYGDIVAEHEARER